ncbi:hypothetical protein LINPERHAP2_LOCUS8456 [Linum perenne]
MEHILQWSVRLEQFGPQPSLPAPVPTNVLAKLVIVPYKQGANARPLVVLPSVFLEILVPLRNIFLHLLYLQKLNELD